MKLILYELQKLAGNRILLIVTAVLLLLNGLFVVRNLFPFTEAAQDCTVPIQEYPATVLRMVETGEENLREYAVMGISETSYAWRVQEKMICQYETVRENVHFTEPTVRGWHLYFGQRGTNGFLFLMLLFLGVNLYQQEQTSGFLPILRCCRYGRSRTVWAKSAAMAVGTILLVLAFSLETWLLCGMENGYSDAGNALQILESYRTCPWGITIGEYFWVIMGMRLLAGLAYGFLCALLSVVLPGRILSFLSSLGILGVNLLLYSMPVYHPDNLPKHLNLFSVALGEFLFNRYRSVNFFEQPVGFLPLTGILYGGILAVVLLVMLILYDKSVQERRFARVENGIMRIVQRGKEVFVSWQQRKTGKNRPYSMSLLLAEGYKMLFASRIWLVILLLFGLKIVTAQAVYQPDETFTDTVYHGYMTGLAGVMTDEKRAFIQEERAYITDILAKERETDEAYRKLEISMEEYEAYRKEYEYAVSRDALFGRIEGQADWIETTAGEAWFVYDTGWLKYFGAGFDWTLYGALLAMTVLVFPMEWDGRTSAAGFAPILRTTRHGRERTFRCKWLAVWLLSTGIAMVWGIIDGAAVWLSYDMMLPDAPLLSIQSYAGVAGNLTLGQFAVLLAGCRILAASSLGLVTMVLSAYVKKTVPTMVCTVLLTLTPKMLSLLGFDGLAVVDFTRFLCSTPLIQEGLMFTATLVVWGVLLIGSLLSEKMWNDVT